MIGNRIKEHKIAYCVNCGQELKRHQNKFCGSQCQKDFEYKEYIDKWKVVVSSANAGGQKRSSQISLIDNHSAFGRSRVALKAFNTKKEAENFKKYCLSNFVKFAFLLTDEALSSLAKWVPDFQDYSKKNKFIDFDDDIDKQLFKLFGLTDAEKNYVIERAKEYKE